MSESLSDARRQILIAVYQLTKHNRPTTPERLVKAGKLIFEDELVDWEGGYQPLLEQGRLRQEGDSYTLTESGYKLAADLAKRHLSSGFDDVLVRSFRSKTYRRFCELVYGRDLCQYNVADMEQLERMLGLLQPGADDRVLDLGCGPGTISEYVSDTTGAHVTGLDCSKAAIELANEVTAEKRDRLNFMVGDMDRLELPPESFDAIIAIDTLYFVEDLDNTICTARTLLAPGGRMAIFHDQHLSPEQPKELLQIEHTKLAKALGKAGLSFDAIDFTGNEERLWQAEIDVAEALKADFEAEGNLDLYRSRIAESERLLKLCASRRVARYLYHAVL
jgi:SAM-dependent methyltransferase